MAQRVTAKRVASQQNDVQREHNRSDAEPEMLEPGFVPEPHRFPSVMSENKQEQQGQIQEIAVNVL